jgi:hypothetical protein
MKSKLKKLILSNPRIKSLHTWFWRLLTVLRFKMLKHRANRIRKATGQQVFVFKWKGKVSYITKKQFKQLRAQKVFPKHFTADSLKRLCLYYTA